MKFGQNGKVAQISFMARLIRVRVAEDNAMYGMASIGRHVFIVSYSATAKVVSAHATIAMAPCGIGKAAHAAHEAVVYAAYPCSCFGSRAGPPSSAYLRLYSSSVSYKANLDLACLPNSEGRPTVSAAIDGHFAT